MKGRDRFLSILFYRYPGNDLPFVGFTNSARPKVASRLCCGVEIFRLGILPIG